MLLFAVYQAATPSASVSSGRGAPSRTFKHFPRIQTEGLAYFSPPLAVIGRTLALPMVSKVRFNAEKDDSAIVIRHPARSQKWIARSRNCVYVVAAQKLPPTSGGYSAVSARTPAPQESTGLTYHR